MERPALARLLAAVEAGAVDAVIVYKVDRLTRSLADFARIVAIFDAAGVSFVSITQAFNTTTSMGRLTLNVLLSFAQFEREVTAERIRDKIAASKARGMWMGGVVPIGYRAEGRSLVPVPEEAALVRRIFARYCALGSVNALRAELDADGIRTPERRHRNGRVSGGAGFSRGKLYAMLANPLFIGRIRHGKHVHAGLHSAIVDADLWEAVQQRLASHRRRRTATRTSDGASLLAGRVFDPDRRKMRPSHASKNGRRYRYYVSAALIDTGVAQGARGWRIPARELENVRIPKTIATPAAIRMPVRAALVGVMPVLLPEPPAARRGDGRSGRTGRRSSRHGSLR
jgi:DNA invertase Pin-like site-specific DNA recombinase